MALISLLAGAAIMLYAYDRAESLLVSHLLAVPAMPIPSYTVIRPEMLAQKEFPRTLVDEPIYIEEADLVGKITTVALQPGQLIYHSHAISLADFRFVADPELEVLSFPVDPSRSVAGRIQIGQRVTIYRMADSTAQENTGCTVTGPQNVPCPTALFTTTQANPCWVFSYHEIPVTGPAYDETAVEVLAENVLVVDAHLLEEKENNEGASLTHILTVAIPHETAVKLIRSIRGQQTEDNLWVSLAPVVASGLAVTEESLTIPVATPNHQQRAMESE
ncbi:MAG: SAF domain-containing protein [Acidobacteria bacterium]|nr:SAF domain-containing protein [Acidobacteriota bacterium]